MRVIFLLMCVLVALILGACATDGVADEGPTAAQAEAAGVSFEDAGEGYAVYLRKCTECHEAILPEAPLSPGWHSTVSGMAWNAGLDKAEEKNLLAYLQAAKPKW